MKLFTLLLLICFVCNLYSQTAEDFYQKGKIKSKNSDLIGAILEYSNAIRLNPTNGLYYNDRAWAKCNLLLYMDAIKDFNKSIELDPNNEYGFQGRAYMKARLKDYRGAIQDYSRAIELNINDSNRDNRGAMYKYIKEESLADHYNSRGEAEDNLKDYRKALIDYNKAIEMSTLYTVRSVLLESFYSNRGILKYKIQDYKEALGDFNNLLLLAPNNPKAICYKGLALLQLGYLDEGCLELSKSGELGNTYAYEMINKYCR